MRVGPLALNSELQLRTMLWSCLEVLYALGTTGGAGHALLHERAAVGCTDHAAGYPPTTPPPFTDSAAGDSWNHLAVRLARTSPDEKGDPDLFGLFSGGKRGLAVPTRSSHGYDFQDTSAAQRAVVVKKVTKAAQGPEADYEGVLLCVRSYGAVPVAFSLKAARNVCPVGFDAGDASPLICSTRQDATEKRYEGCTADGQCLCTGQYAKPVPEVVPGKGV